MKMSCLPVSMFSAISSGKMTVGQYAQLCRSFGLDGFDLGIILLKNHTPRYIAEVNDEIRAAGIPLVMLTTYPDFTHPDKMQREREYDYLLHDIALASAVNAKYLRVTAGQQHPGITRYQSVAWPVSYLEKASRVADKYNVQLVFENHSISKGWFYMDVSSSPEVFMEIVVALEGSSIAINFDIANFLMAGQVDTIEMMDKVIDKILTIHVADTSAIGKMDPVQLGTGVVPMKDIFRYLRTKDFNGWLCLEIWKDEGEQAMKNAVDHVRYCWETA